MSADVISMEEINAIRDRRITVLHERGFRGAELAKQCALTEAEATERCQRLGLSLDKPEPVRRGARPRRAQS